MPTPTGGGATSSVAAAGDYRIDALLPNISAPSGATKKWGGPLGDDVTLTYSFPEATSVWTPTYGSAEPFDADYRALDGIQQSAFRNALNAWAEVADITFTEITETATEVGEIRAAFSGVVTGAAWAYYPFPAPEGGDVWLNADLYGGHFSGSLAPGSAGFHTFLHEIGHALGLGHPFEGSIVLPGFEDTFQYTVMSYTSYAGASSAPATPMLYDVLAIQYLYGANDATRADDTTYTFSTTSAQLRTLWDGGGHDTIDAANQTLGVDIDLDAGAFSSIGPSGGGAATDNIAIAFGVTIEDAKGGSGSDTIAGNDAANYLEGGGGGDRLDGRAGDDTLSGGAGNDTLAGESGADVFVFTATDGAGTDVITDWDAGDLIRLSGAQPPAISKINYVVADVDLKANDVFVELASGQKFYVLNARDDFDRVLAPFGFGVDDLAGTANADDFQFIADAAPLIA